MSFSFRRTRQLGLGGLLVLMLVVSAIAVGSLRDVTRNMQYQVTVQEVKEQQFGRVALLFAQARATFYKQRAEQDFAQAALLTHLNGIRAVFTALQQMPLSSFEHTSLTQLVQEEKRFRTAVYVLMHAGTNDPSEESEARTYTEVEGLITAAMDRALVTSDTVLSRITQASTQLMRSTTFSLRVLVIGTVVTLLVGLGVSMMLSRLLNRPIQRMLLALEELGHGHFSHRIRIAATDEVGQMATSIDAMAGRLEANQQQLHTTFTDLEAAKQVAEVQAHELAVKTETLSQEITERQQAERALREAHETLEQRVAARTAELVHANEQLSSEIAERKRVEETLQSFATDLERSNRELQDFAYVASHDLQEPLRKIQAFGDRLKARCGEAISEQGQDYLARMQNAAGRMQTLIEDLLMFSRVTTQSRAFVSVDLAQVAREVVVDLEVRIEEVGGEVKIGALPTLEADPVQMRQLLQNLLGNALKFHRPEVPPRVTVEAHRLQPGEQEWAGESADRTWYQLTVRDNGIGFDDKYTDRIFTVFQRLHGRSAYAGTGVGLAVCRKIAERHGGRITAQSTPGEGATFVATLPGIASQETIVP